jgi:phosphonate transport system substrate-binding protein
MLDDGRVHVAFICGWSYTQRHDRPERPVDVLCAPVMAAPRYEDRPIYFTDVVVRHDRPGSRSPTSGVGAMRSMTPARIPDTTCPGITCSGLARPGATSGARSRRGPIRRRSRWSRRARSTPRESTARCLTSSATGGPELCTALRTVAVLGPSPIPPVIVTRALAENRKERLRAALLAMHEDAEAGRSWPTGSWSALSGCKTPTTIPSAPWWLAPSRRASCSSGDRGVAITEGQRKSRFWRARLRRSPCGGESG